MFDGTDLTLSGIYRSEWSKLVSLRSVVVAACSMPLIALMGCLVAVMPVLLGAPEQDAAPSLMLQSIRASSVPLALLSSTIGLLSLGSEYRDETISSTLSAVPHRRRLLLMKSAASFVLATFAAALSTALMLGVTALFLSNLTPWADIGTATLALGLSSLGVGGFAVLGAAAVSIQRSVASAVVTLVCLFAILPVAASTLFVPPVREAVSPLLPTTAAMSLSLTPSQTGPIVGGTVLAGWVVISVGMMLVTAYRDGNALHSSTRRRQRRPTTSNSTRAAALTISGQLWSALYRFISMRAAKWSAIMTIAVAATASAFQASSIASTASSSIDAGEEQLWLQADLGVSISSTANLLVLFVPLIAAALVLRELTHAPASAILVAAPRRRTTLFTALATVALIVFITVVIALVAAALTATPILRTTYADAPVATVAMFIPAVQGALTVSAASLLICAIAVLSRSLVATTGLALIFFVAIPAVVNSVHAKLIDTGNVWIFNALILLPNGSTTVAIEHLDWTWVASGGELLLHPYAQLALNGLWSAFALVGAAMLFSRRSITS